MSIQSLTPMPAPPLPTDAEAVFDAHAGASLTAQVTFTNEMNTGVIPGINAAVLDVTNKAESATSSANAAAGSATAANASKNAAETAAQTAQIAAAASGASAGIGQLGQPGDSLQVNPARTGLVFGPSDGKVGDVLISARNPGSLFVPANGGIRAQSALPSLLGVVGFLGSQFGQSYTTVSPSGAAALDVAMAANPTGLAPFVMQILAAAQVNFSSDGGFTWASRTAIPATPTSISYDELNGLWLVTNGSNATIYTSADNGVTWQTTTGSMGGLVGGLAKVVASLSGVWIAIGQGSNAGVWRSTDGGATWTAKTTGAAIAHAAITTDHKGVWIVVGSTSIRRSIDDGLTWVVQFTAAASVSSIATDRNGTLMVGCSASGAIIYRSVDNGQTFFTLTIATATVSDITYTQGYFFIVRNVSPQVLMISASADATVFIIQSTAVLASLTRISSYNGYIFAVNSANATLLRSFPSYAYDFSTQFQLPNLPLTNGLRAWVKAGLTMLSSGKVAIQGSATGLQAGSAAIETDGYGTVLAVSGSDIRRSTDGGTTWATVSNNSGSNLSSVTTNRRGRWVIGGANTVMVSTDNGLNFTVVPSANHGFSDSTVAKIVFGLNDILFACSSASRFPRKSIDGGLNWTAISVSADIYRVASNGFGRWVMIAAGKAYVSNDNGVTFGASVDTGNTSTISDVIISNDGTITVSNVSTASSRVSIDGGVTWSAGSTLPIAGMILKPGIGRNIIGVSGSAAVPLCGIWVSAGVYSWVIGTTSGTAPSQLTGLTRGDIAPVIFIGTVAATRVVYNGTLDTPV